jgi:hypothetical protein
VVTATPHEAATSTAHEAVTLEGTSSMEAATNSAPAQRRDDEGDLHCGGGRDRLMFSTTPFHFICCRTNPR